MSQREDGDAVTHRQPRARHARRLTPSQRRLDARLIARLAAWGEATLRHAPDYRAARRLQEAGLVVAVCSRSGWWRRRLLAEVRVYPTRAAAWAAGYGREAVMR